MTYPSTFRALINSSGSGGSLTGVFGDNVTCNSFVPSTSTTTSLSFLMPLFWDLDFFDLWLCECFNFFWGGSSEGFFTVSVPKQIIITKNDILVIYKIDYCNVIKISY